MADVLYRQIPKVLSSREFIICGALLRIQPAELLLHEGKTDPTLKL